MLAVVSSGISLVKATVPSASGSVIVLSEVAASAGALNITFSVAVSNVILELLAPASERFKPSVVFIPPRPSQTYIKNILKTS